MKFEKNKHNSIICLFLIGLIDTIFVGLRDFGVGYDTNVYIEPYFYAACSIDSITDFFETEFGDPGFLLLSYIASLFSDDPQSLLVVTELFIISFTLIGLYNYKQILRLDFRTYILLYWLVLFFFSENFMRQFCAMSLTFCAFSFWGKNNKILYSITQIVAFFFHSSSLIFLFVPFLDYISKKSSKKKWIFSVVFILSLAIFITSFYTTLALLGDIGVITEVYSDRYSSLGDGTNTKGIELGILNILSIICQIAIYYFAKKEKIISERVVYMFLILYITTFMFELLVAFNVNMNRLALYFSQIYLLYLAVCFKFYKNSLNKCLKIIILSSLLLKCIRTSFNHNYEPQDYTYSSAILGIDK